RRAPLMGYPTAVAAVVRSCAAGGRWPDHKEVSAIEARLDLSAAGDDAAYLKAEKRIGFRDACAGVLNLYRGGEVDEAAKAFRDDGRAPASALSRCRPRGAPVVAECLGRLVDIYPALKPAHGEHVIRKHRYSAFSAPISICSSALSSGW